MNSRFLVPFVPVLLGASLCAQSPVVRIRSGDALVTGDHVTEVFRVRTHDLGAWFAWVDTDSPLVTQDALLLADGQVLLREGQALAAPAGSTLGDVLLYDVEANGDLAALFHVLPAGLPGVYFNASPLVFQGDAVGAPEVPAATPWVQLGSLWLDPARTLLVSGEIDDPNVAGSSEDALVRIQLDGGGAVSSTNVLLKKGQALAVLGGPITSLGSSANSFALNGRGDFIGTVFSSGNPALVLRNTDTVLARTSDPAPIAGRTYRSFTTSKVALNDLGGTAFTAALNGLVDSYCIIRDGQKFAQEGDLFPPMTQPIGDDGDDQAPLYLTNSGDLFWRAWDDVHAEEAYLRNHQVFVLNNSTVVDGHVVTGLARDPGAFHASRDGRFWVGRVELASVGEALLAVDFGLVVPRPGCAGNPARLTKAGGDARVGQRLTLELDDAQAVGALPLLFFSGGPAVVGSDCGIVIPAGEALVDPALRVATFTGPAWNGAPVAFHIDIPASVALVDLELFGQGVFVDPGGPAGLLRLSNGVRVQVGAP